MFAGWTAQVLGCPTGGLGRSCIGGLLRWRVHGRLAFYAGFLMFSGLLMFYDVFVSPGGLWKFIIVCSCLCLRTENRSRKTHVFEYRDCGVGWGRHVNGPCTSYMKYCHAADISGIVYYVICCYAWGGVGWGGGGMLTFLVLRTWNIATLLRSPGSFTTLHVATLLKVESDEKVNSQQLECQKWPLDGVC